MSKIMIPDNEDRGSPRYVTPTVGPRGWNDYDRKCLWGIGAQVLFFLIATVALLAR